MNISKTISGFLVCLLFPVLALAQETDSTRRNLHLQNQRQQLLQQPLERQLSGGIMSEMGTYQVPEKTQYYTPPFKGQEYLDMAVEAYRRELEERIGPQWLSKFFKTVSPFINNKFEFGVYQIYDLPIVERDHPLFQSYK